MVEIHCVVYEVNVYVLFRPGVRKLICAIDPY
jgi:hypothetical protein